MGFDEGRIVLDSANGAYYPGQTIHGRLEFDQDHVKTFRGIYVKVKGFCKVHWTTTRSRRVNDRTEHYTVNHDSYEEYLNYKVFLAGGESGEHQLQPGHHTFPFECVVTPNCPTSFEGNDGHVRYQIKAVVDRAFKFDQKKVVVFRVVAPLDLNTLPNCSEPVGFEITNTYCCWCMGAGATQTLVKLPVAGYCPGQVMPIEVSCKNEGSVEVDTIKFTLKMLTTFTATYEPGTRDYSEDIAEIKKGPIPANATRKWTVEMAVPAIDAYNLRSCRYIDIYYRFKVKVESSGCHTDEDDSLPIIIGNIPIKGFQDNVPNPLQDQLPSQPLVTVNVSGVTSSYPPPPIVTQPMGGGYPGGPPPQVAPYPVGPVSYPGANPPYPGANPPYPGANPPYPGVNPPYPGANPPYPGANPPYPGANPPYPGGNPPYPGANLSHPSPGGPAGNAHPPGVNSYPPPYPGVDRPYPNTPQHGKTSPYPATSSPYPANNSYNSTPYPDKPLNTTIPTDRSPLLKTGNLGFVGAVNPSNTVPSLPPGVNIPYPSAVSPFIGASAPAPSTPDDENKPPINGNT